ncbi:uncharacterized protein Bfra_003528 [Botrytis fragariae]|uniref:Uncharacterized protein n=1 Tax=Botrytis fragariae TaxID=1964551 RepID=A0A8H6AX22_9HELO|nr:uncharacterized protein Bfra_003528 [Botrytis fragariae]KAF5875074.1 hypothetical protein Bfra_003528 [Botrytis fragariae]
MYSIFYLLDDLRALIVGLWLRQRDTTLRTLVPARGGEARILVSFAEESLLISDAVSTYPRDVAALTANYNTGFLTMPVLAGDLQYYNNYHYPNIRYICRR